MKKSSRKLDLRKETLVSLSNDRLRYAIGGVDELSHKKCTTISRSDLCPTGTKDTIPIYSDKSCPEVGCTVVTNP